MLRPLAPDGGNSVLADTLRPIPIYLPGQDWKGGEPPSLFDDSALESIRYPWQQSGVECDVIDRSDNVIFRKFERPGPHELGTPIVFATYDTSDGEWLQRGSFVIWGSVAGVNVHSYELTSLIPAASKGNQRERLNDYVLKECGFPRLTQYAVATARDSLTRFGTIVVAKDGRLESFKEKLRYYELQTDDRGRGFDYDPVEPPPHSGEDF